MESHPVTLRIPDAPTSEYMSITATREHLGLILEVARFKTSQLGERWSQRKAYVYLCNTLASALHHLPTEDPMNDPQFQP